jgi:serine/threonine protein kinase
MAHLLRFGLQSIICKFILRRRSALLQTVNISKSRYVALKVMMAKQSASADTELEICGRLATVAPNDPYSKYVVMLLDSFEHSGPNGRHCCLVYEPMGSTAASMVEKLPWNTPQSFPPKTLRYPKWMAKRILKHALSGLAFLHKNGVVHGDFQPGNLLFSSRELNSISENELQQDKVNITRPLRRLDGKADKWAPRYLMLKQSLHEHVDLGPDTVVKVSDFGAGKVIAITRIEL